MTRLEWNSLIADGDASDSKYLKMLLQKSHPQVSILAEPTTLDDAIDCIQKRDINLIFCNYKLKDGTAFDLFDRMRNFKGHLILLHETDEFALRAFRDYNAFDYLRKPVSAIELEKVIERLEIRNTQSDPNGEVSNRSSQHKKFAAIILNAGGLQHIVQILDIVSLEGDGNYTVVYLTSGEKIMVTKPLKHFEDVLPAKYFFRVHQSYIVNILYVKSVQNGDSQIINLSNMNSVPLARRKKEDFLTWLAR